MRSIRESARTVVSTLVMPLGEMIHDPGGVAYLRITSQLSRDDLWRFSVLEQSPGCRGEDGSDGIRERCCSQGSPTWKGQPPKWLSKCDSSCQGVLYHVSRRLREDAPGGAFSLMPLQKPEEFFNELIESNLSPHRCTSSVRSR